MVKTQIKPCLNQDFPVENQSVARQGQTRKRGNCVVKCFRRQALMKYSAPQPAGDQQIE